MGYESANTNQVQQTNNTVDDLLDTPTTNTEAISGGKKNVTAAYSLDDFGGGMMSQQNIEPKDIKFNEHSDLESDKFQNMWMQLQESGKINCTFNKEFPSINDIEEIMKQQRFFSVASGQVGSDYKFFFHCKLANEM